MTIPASKVRKGQRVKILGTVVEVTKREKWSPRHVKVYFKDCGFGMPPGHNRMLPFTTAEFFPLEEELELA